MDTTPKCSHSFSYMDVFFSYYFNDDRACAPMINEHMLMYIYSGELVLDDRGKKVVMNAGECVFLRKDNRVNMTKQPKGEEPYQGITMVFKRNFLREFYQAMDKTQIPVKEEKELPSIIKLPQNPNIASLFKSMTPYFDSTIQPSDQLMKLKQQEGVYSLLHLDPKFYPILFDFTEPWKIDIIDFMDQNYMYDLTLEDIAHFTGRSLATFKRDFKKISDLSPQKWLIEKRLRIAHDKIRNQRRRVSDVYLEVGFKNLSHFSTAFKKQFGYAPTE